jgi:hypothetical protein
MRVETTYVYIQCDILANIYALLQENVTWILNASHAQAMQRRLMYCKLANVSLLPCRCAWVYVLCKVKAQNEF